MILSSDPPKSTPLAPRRKPPRRGRSAGASSGTKSRPSAVAPLKKGDFLLGSPLIKGSLLNLGLLESELQLILWLNKLNNLLIPFNQNPEHSDDTLRISELLQRFLEQHQGDEVRLRDLFNEMGERAFGPTLLICALPEALPLPIAGISALVAMPLMLVSGQLVLGFEQPWLPDWLMERSFKKDLCEQVISGAIPFLEKLESFVEPRWPFFTSPEAERCVGAIVLLLGIVIALPIPFGNMLPAIAIVLICLGLIEKDGLIIAIGGLIVGITPALLLLVL